MKYRVFQIDKKRVVEEAEARIWAETKGYHYFETSAQTGEGVSEMFQVCTCTRQHTTMAESSRQFTPTFCV